jgi:hypothetical protein
VQNGGTDKTVGKEKEKRMRYENKGLEKRRK